MRKPGWFRLENIGYENDIGDLEGAVKTLCQKKIQSASMKAEDENAAAGPSRSKNVDIDLTMDDDEEDIPKDESGSVSDFSRLAINEEGLRLLENAEILNLLDSEELESLAKRMKVTVPGKKLSASVTISWHFQLSRLIMFLPLAETRAHACSFVENYESGYSAFYPCRERKREGERGTSFQEEGQERRDRSCA